MLFLDLDRFKTVNDSLGHAAGDELLALASERWKQALRPTDTLARVGGDEFVVLLENLRDAHEAAAIAQRLIAATSAPFTLAHEREACVGLSVGASLFPADGGTPDALIQRADSALYLSKQSGGGALNFYSEDVTAEANARLAMEAGLRRAPGARRIRAAIPAAGFPEGPARWSASRRWCAGARRRVSSRPNSSSARGKDRADRSARRIRACAKPVRG